MAPITSVGLLVALLFRSTSSTKDSYGCGNKPADVEFVLDSSGSIMYSDFRKQLNFTENLVDLFDIGQNKTRVGMVSFSTQVIPEFKLGEFNDKKDIKEKIQSVWYQGGGTNTGKALNYVRTQSFPVNGGRPDVPHIVIILTDGMSQDFRYTVQEAAAAHNQGITVFVIGIGDQVDEKELKAIASKPTDNFMFEIDNFDALKTIKDTLAIRTCKVPPATPPPPTPPPIDKDAVVNGNAHCSPEMPVELKVALDTAAIGIDNSKFILRFLAELSDRLDLPQSHSEIETVTNGCATQSLGDITFGSGHDREKIEQSMADTTKGVSSMMRRLRQSFTRGDQKKKVGVVFMGATLSNGEYRKALRETSRASFLGIKLFVVGVGERVSTQQTRVLATNSDQAFFAESYDNLQFVEGPLLLKICTLK
ncbi:cartilage matrix protein-like [Saccostrea cucullata]|uniref:cartilage matrix protein-like n=1 Tax=Saccostrea cuccullata TaxID=36930 RepID=UPI002ED56D0A